MQLGEQHVAIGKTPKIKFIQIGKREHFYLCKVYFYSSDDKTSMGTSVMFCRVLSMFFKFYLFYLNYIITHETQRNYEIVKVNYKLFKNK